MSVQSEVKPLKSTVINILDEISSNSEDDGNEEPILNSEDDGNEEPILNSEDNGILEPVLLDSEDMNILEEISSISVVIDVAEPFLDSEDIEIIKCLKYHYKNKNVDEFFELLEKSVKLLYGREFDQDESLFEYILKTDNDDHAEFIRQIWIEFELWNNVAILTETNSQGKIPFNYVLESRSILNFICFLVYDYNTPKSVGSTDEKKYFLELKNQQYFNKVGHHLLFELYLVNKYDKINQGTCLQIIEELLKEKLYSITDIEIIIGNDQITKSLYDDIGAEILNLIAIYWDFKQNPVEFGKHKVYLTARSPFCKIILALKQGTEDTFIELFNRYLEEMKDKYKKCPNLHEVMLQKDKKYLLNYEMFAVQYRKIENKYHIIREIKKDPELLDLYDDFIFTLLSPDLQEIKDQILNSTDWHQLLNIINKIGCKEIVTLLLARSQDGYENLLEKMLKNQNLMVYHILESFCDKYRMETVFTKKMLLMRNPFGKQLIDYCNQIDHINWFNFLWHSLSSFKKQSLLLLINEQLKDKFNTTIFKILYKIILNNNNRSNCMYIFEDLLIDMVEIEDMEYECDIETVFKMDSATRDDIFQLLFYYWKPDRTIYEQYKVRYSLTDKFYNLMLMLKVENDDNFPEAFALYLKEINDIYSFEYSGRAEVLLSLALKLGRKKAMESIVELQTINVNELRIHTYESLPNYDENKNFLMKLLLKHGYNLHEKVNSEVYKESLDDRVIERDEKIISVKYKSGLRASEKVKESVKNYIRIDYKSFCNVFGLENNDKSLFSFKSILNTRGLRDNMTHPVLSIINNLKALEFQQLRQSNFWTFIFLIIIPFYVLLFSLNEVNSWLFWYFYLLCLSMVCFGMFRYAKNIMICRLSLKNYSTLIDFAFLMLSALILVLILIPKGIFSREGILTEVSVIFILVATINLLLIIPYPKISIYMLMFIRIAMDFWKFLVIFFAIIFAFALTFCISMKPVTVSNEQSFNNETFILTKLELETIIANSLKRFDAEENVTHNFNNVFTSILKTIQMLSGEYTIEPFSLDTTFQKVLFFCFVLTSFILFNFIIGLVTSDIQNIRKEADILILQNQMEYTMNAPNEISKIFSVKLEIKIIKIINYISTCCYKLFTNDLKKKNPIRIKSSMFGEYEFLNDLKYLYIDRYNEEVFMMNENNQKLVINTNSLFFSKPYKLTKETLDSLIDIVNKNKIIEENRVQS